MPAKPKPPPALEIGPRAREPAWEPATPLEKDVRQRVDLAPTHQPAYRTVHEQWENTSAWLAVIVHLDRLRSEPAVMRSPVAVDVIGVWLQTAQGAFFAHDAQTVLKPLETALPSGKAVEHRSRTNSENASKERPRILETDRGSMTMEKIVRGLVASNPDGSAKSLWNELVGTLQVLGLSPVVNESSNDWRKWSIDYDGGHIKGSGLQRLVTKIIK